MWFSREWISVEIIRTPVPMQLKTPIRMPMDDASSMPLRKSHGAKNFLLSLQETFVAQY